MASQAVALDLAQRAERLRERNLRIGPMQQEEIDFAEAQPHEAISRGALKLARREMRRPDFRGHENVVALDAGGVQPLAHFALVIVHFRGVDVAIAEPQSLLDNARTGAAAQIPCAKANQGNFRTLGLDARYRSHVAHVSYGAQDFYPSCPISALAVDGQCGRSAVSACRSPSFPRRSARNRGCRDSRRAAHAWR